MLTLKYSALAESDLLEIARYTEARWNSDQARDISSNSGGHARCFWRIHERDEAAKECGQGYVAWRQAVT